MIVTGSGRRRVSVNSQIQGVGITYLFVLVGLLIYSQEIKDYSRISSAHNKIKSIQECNEASKKKQSNLGFQGRAFHQVSGTKEPSYSRYPN